MTEANIELLAVELRDLYVMLRRMARPGYTSNPLDEKYWLQLATLVIENHLDGKHYIQWIYEFYTIHRPTVFVRQLTSPKAVQLYLNQAPSTEQERRADLALKLDIQRDVIDSMISAGRTVSEIVLDYDLALGVVMRYVLALSGGLEDIAKQFRSEAEREVFFNPLYKTILGDKLPLSGEG